MTEFSRHFGPGGRRDKTRLRIPQKMAMTMVAVTSLPEEDSRILGTHKGTP